MSYRVALSGLMAIALGACTAPNPLSCADGLCTDQRYPYCDEDGTFEGVPQTCIAVECMPDQFVRCLGDRAVSCNGTGNDYEFDSCPNGCSDDSGCRQCATNEQCPTSMPLCDASGTCRACIQDDDCASRVCETGACVAEAAILYASSGGGDNSDCSKATPCLIGRALLLARVAAVPPTIRMLPGAYATSLVLDTATAGPLSIVGTGATLVSANPIVVSGPARARFRGVSITATNAAITCGDTNPPRSTLVLEDIVVEAGGILANLVAINQCDLTMKRSRLKLNSSSGTGVALTSDANFIGDRIHLTGTMGGMGGLGTRMNFVLTNSLIETSSITFTTFDSTSPGSVIKIGYSTLIGGYLDCQPENFRTNAYDNNIVVNTNLANVVNGTNCRLHNNVLYPQATTLPENISADPQFMNPAAGDFHLEATSPAIDAAGATGDFPLPAPDLEGRVRPQGAKADVGAFERAP